RPPRDLHDVRAAHLYILPLISQAGRERDRGTDYSLPGVCLPQPDLHRTVPVLASPRSGGPLQERADPFPPSLGANEKLAQCWHCVVMEMGSPDDFVLVADLDDLDKHAVRYRIHTPVEHGEAAVGRRDFLRPEDV